jgi:hypothetical protein
MEWQELSKQPFNCHTLLMDNGPILTVSLPQKGARHV